MLGRLSRTFRALISVVFSAVTVLFFYGYLTPLGLSPTLIFGSDFSNIFGTATTTGSVTDFVPSAYASLIPGGATGLVVYTVLRRFGGVARSAMAPSMSSPNEVLRMMNIPQMAGLMGQMPGPMGGLETLPADITRSQFVVLGCYRQGLKNTGAIAKSLSMDKKDVESDAQVLMSNGYLSKDSKLTSKAMDLLGN